MTLKAPVQKCAEVIIGHDLRAILFSYLTDTPIIINKKSHDGMFDFCDPELPLRLVGLQNDITTLKTIDGCVRFGTSKSKLRSDLLLSLSVSGLLLNSISPWNIKIQDGKVDYFTKAKKNSVIYNYR